MDWWKLKLYRCTLRLLEEVGDTQNPVEWNKPVYPSITLLAALYRRRIPALTMTVAWRGTPLHEHAGCWFIAVRPWSHDAGLSDIEFIENKPERLRVLSGDPAGYGAEGARVFAIYENFPV